MILPKQKRFIILASIIALLALASGVVWFFIFRTPTTTQELNQAQKDNTETIKNQSINSDSKTSGSDQTPTPVPSANPASKAQTSVTMTAVNQTDTTLQLRAMIGALETDGKCSLTLTDSTGKQLVKTSGTQALASSMTCQGFNVPLSEVSSGEWRATIGYESSKSIGFASQAITIR